MAEAHGGEGPPAPLTERGARTRERLIAAAREVFEERGYPGTRVAHIAQHAARVRIGAAAHDPSIAEHDEGVPGPRTLKPG